MKEDLWHSKIELRHAVDVVESLVKNPSYIHRLGKSRPGRCVDCGALTWEERCRKCRKALKRKLNKQQAKINRGRNAR